jgi:hypothetical protein
MKQQPDGRELIVSYRMGRKPCVAVWCYSACIYQSVLVAMVLSSVIVNCFDLGSELCKNHGTRLMVD